MSDAIAPASARNAGGATAGQTPAAPTAPTDAPVKAGAVWSAGSQFATAVNRTRETLSRPLPPESEPARQPGPVRVALSAEDVAAVQRLAKVQSLNRHFEPQAQENPKPGDSTHQAGRHGGRDEALDAGANTRPTARFLQVIDGRIMEVTITLGGLWYRPLANAPRPVSARPRRQRLQTSRPKRDPWALVGTGDAYTIRSVEMAAETP